MKKIGLLLMFSLVCQNASASMSLDSIVELLSRSEVTRLNRIKSAEIDSFSINKMGGDSKSIIYSVSLTYFPQLTAEEYENSEGPGICEAKLRVNALQVNCRAAFGCDDKVEVLSNNCFQ